MNNLPNSLQVIYYGAPGTGKSHTTDGIIADFPDSHQRTTFHPDTDYSSFVGCYKPTRENDSKLFHYDDIHILALERKRDENDTICATIEQEATLTPFNLQ